MAKQESGIVSFNRENLRDVTDEAGIYAIYHPEADTAHIYLGRAKNLKRRLGEHLSAGSKANKTVKMLIEMGETLLFSWSTSDNYKGAESAELNRYMPIGNQKIERKYLEDFDN